MATPDSYSIMGRRRRGPGRGGKKRSGKTSRRSNSDDYSYSDSDFSIDYDTPQAFDIGARVECPSLTGYSAGDGPHTGTVAGHWKRRSHWPEHMKAPYLVLLDDGMAIYCHRTDEDFIRKTDVPPMKVIYNIGCRVECKFESGDSKWFPGTVLQCHEDWALSPIDTPPYLIRFDYGREKPFFGPEHHIRPTNIVHKRGPDKPLRFDVGDRVKCLVDEEWVAGQIIKTHYREEEFENGHAVPYQILLGNGNFIYAPLDEDSCIKRDFIPDVPLRFKPGDRVDCSVDDGWMPGTVLQTQYKDDEEFKNGRVVPYQILLDDGDLIYAPVDHDMFIRKSVDPDKPLRFKVGDRVDCLFEDGWMPGTVLDTHFQDDDINDGRLVPYQVQLDMGGIAYAPDDDDNCIKKSDSPHVCRGEHNGFIHVMSKMLIYNEEYDDARDMLEERITLIRSRIEKMPQDKDAIVDLSNFLLYLAEVHQATGCLQQMEAALDEALALIELSQDKFRSHRLLNVTAKLAMHSALTSNKYAALKYSEEAIILAKKTMAGKDSFRLGLMLLQCGKLNMGCDKRERGLVQMSEGVDILTRLYGSDNSSVRMAKDELEKLREGS